MKTKWTTVVAVLAMGGVASAAELMYNFENVSGTTVFNSGTWGSDFDGTLTSQGTLTNVGILSGAPWGRPMDTLPLNNVLHSVTTVGSGITTNLSGVSFYTADTGSGGHTVGTNFTLSFWLMPVTVNGNGFVGTAGGQLTDNNPTGEPHTFAYNASGSLVQNQWYWTPPGSSGTRYTGMAFNEWHFYTVTMGNTFNASQNRLYRDGQWVAQLECCYSRDAFMDSLGVRVGGISGGSTLYIDNIIWQPGLTITSAEAYSLFDHQFIPEPTTVILLAAGGLLLWRLRRQR